MRGTKAFSGRDGGAFAPAGRPGGVGLAAWLWALAAVLPWRAAFGAELKLGVVNIGEINARYKKAEDLRKAHAEKFKARKEDIERRRRELARRIAEYQGDLRGEADPARAKEAREIEVQQLVLNQDVREYQREESRARDRIIREVADDVAAACRRLGEARGYDLILKLYGPDRTASDDRERLEAFQLDVLLYCSPAVDITGDVLQLLEDAYRRGLKLVPEETVEPPRGGRG